MSKVKFRNYRQRDEPPVDESTPSVNVQELLVPKGIEKETLEIEKEVDDEKQEVPVEEDAVDLVDLAPKKPNWDLKRDLQEKYVELESATTAAIRELIRSRLTAQHDISKINDV